MSRSGTSSMAMALTTHRRPRHARRFTLQHPRVGPAPRAAAVSVRGRPGKTRRRRCRSRVRPGGAASRACVPARALWCQ
ncbi:hypothetical protein ACR6C2_30595 [Streptomyces sp. INA 01156]